MDVVIPLLEHSANEFGELRFTLRSFEKYMPDFDRLVIVGPAVPEWLKTAEQQGDVLHVMFVDDPQPRFKDANIFLKVRAYIEKVNALNDFIFANDDYYLLQPFDIYAPFPHKGTLSEAKKSRSTMDPYRKVISNTIEIIGYEALNLDLHCPMLMNPVPFKKVFGDRPVAGGDPDDKDYAKKVADYHGRRIKWTVPMGFLFKSLYGEKFPHGLREQDVKFYKAEDVAPVDGLKWFSTADPAYTPQLEAMLAGLFPEPSRFEKLAVYE